MMHRLVYRSGEDRLALTPDAGVLVSAIDGLTEQNITLDTTAATNGIGVTVNSQAVGAKRIVISGTLLGYAADTRRRMLALIAPMRPGTLLVDEAWHIDVLPTITPVIERYDHNPGFTFTLTAPKPYFVSTSETAVTMRGITKLFSFPINFAAGYQLGSYTAETYKNVPNEGNVPCGLSVTIRARGDVVNPKIEHMLTGDYVLFNKTLHDTDVLTYTYSGGKITAVYSAGGTDNANAFGALSIDSVPFELQSGDNPIKCTATTGYALMDVTIAFSPAYAGVY